MWLHALEVIGAFGIGMNLHDSEVLTNLVL